ncbi:MAG: ABC transporter ATP-binding protein [Streptosporangiales bacterium]|nr:ABC transporter ATP-binding protein [Streptosporangiales bacterium]MBO0889812.1 ABC transporter ATP-binding protein [Acidothermales bacterium]
MIEFESVTKRFPGGGVGVEDVSLTIPTGKITVFVGPSGCGKTTSLRMINRMLEPSSGRILHDGQDVAKLDKAKLRRGMGYVIQQVGLLPHRTIVDNVCTVPFLLGRSKARARADAVALLERVGLDPVIAKRYPAQLSGGQQQRVGVARALAADPPVMLMDEPFSAVDPIVRESLQDEFLRLQHDLGKTIVFVTHDVDEAVKLGDQVAVFGGGGRLVQVDAPEDLLGRPRNAFVASLIGRDRGYRRLSFVPARDLPSHDVVTVSTDATTREVHETSERTGKSWVLSVDSDGRPVSWLDGRGDGDDLGRVPVGNTFTDDDSCRAALDGALASPAGLAVHVDADGRVVGGVGHDEIARYVTSLRSAEGGTAEDAGQDAAVEADA